MPEQPLGGVFFNPDTRQLRFGARPSAQLRSSGLTKVNIENRPARTDKYVYALHGYERKVAAGRRVGWFGLGNTIASLKAEGWTLFDAAVLWAGGWGSPT